MNATLTLNPALPLWVIALLGGAALGAALFAAMRGLGGAGWRALAGAVVIAALLGPDLRQEQRQPLDDIVLLAVDDSASNRLAGRPDQTGQTAAAITAKLTRPGLTVKEIRLADGGQAGTHLWGAINAALAAEPAGRIAGIIALTDGQLHDPASAPAALPAPFHVLLSGQASDWDRRLRVINAPAFAIINEETRLTLRLDDTGAGPGQSHALLDIAVNGAPPQRVQVPLGQDLDLPFVLPHGGRNVIELTVPPHQDELTDRNNTALIEINGIRDRLRVLLVSGEPHAGGRTWRNLLKSDSAVDLVHFTILRPPDKQDGVPVGELSLIAFPTRELFLEKIDDFDLIIFDRFKRRGILPSAYLANVAQYVQTGGAVLISAGPEFAGADSIFRTPLETILPAAPTARVITAPFRPQITPDGLRHPVTRGLPGAGEWGRWWRQIEMTPQSGQVLMTGANDKPLLVLDRVGQGRVALLASDHAWLWSRGYEGGGPQLEMLRRLAHWMMKEPELEEEALTAENLGGAVQITRRTMAQTPSPLSIIAPDGQRLEVPLTPDANAPGSFGARFESDQIGVYTLQSGDLRQVIGLGSATPREYEQPVASGAMLAPFATSITRMEDGLPQIRQVRAGRPSAGRGWIGITPRGAYETHGQTRRPLLPAWLVLMVGLGALLAAWWIEGRRERPS